jgi:mono/diheme cytochrome c family protein
MQYGRLLALVCVTFVVCLGLQVQAALRTDRSSAWVSRPRELQSTDVANLYRINCQMCHGPNGKALIPEMAFFNRPKWKHGTKTSDMIKTITEGVPGTPMVSFKSKFTAAEIRALARYVRSFDKRLPPEK